MPNAKIFRTWQQSMESWQSLDPIQRIDLYARLMDTAIGIPGTKMRVGVDPVLSFIPFLGSFIGFLLSTYVLLEAWLARASTWTLLRMVGNYLIDALVGAVPFVGPFLDIWSKAHVRNARLLREHLMRRRFHQPRLTAGGGPWLWLGRLLFKLRRT